MTSQNPSSEDGRRGRSTFETRQMEPLGVEILGLDLRAPLSEERFDELKKLIMDVGLVLFRDCELTSEEQVALGRRLGRVERNELNAGASDPEVIVISNLDAEGQTLSDDDPTMKLVSINEGWHTDSSFRPIPASFSVLTSLVIPEQGGDTLFASLRLGWDALDEAEQDALYGLSAVHDYADAYRTRSEGVEGTPGQDLPEVSHPLVRAHPETAATSLFLSEHARRIEGWEDEPGAALLRRLLLRCTRPEQVYRHRWAPGDLVIWDNRSMLHRAEGFDARFPRVMRHVRIEGNEAVIAAEPAPMHRSPHPS